MTRTFIAVELGDAARASLTRQIARLRAELPAIHWVDPASVHLTLAFLGELDDDQLARAVDATRLAAHSSSPFALHLAGLGTFGRPDAPRVIWAGVGGDLERLRHLHAALWAALAGQGFTPEERDFSPHLTLARLRTPLAPDQAMRLHQLVRPAAPTHPGSHIAVTELSVMMSELLRPAARYTRLHAMPLG